MLSQAASAQAAEKAVIAGYNAKLVQRVAAFEAAHPNVCFIIIAMICIGYGGSDATPQVTTKIWDSNTAFTAVLDSPKTYGFVDATSFGNPGDFWGYVLKSLVCTTIHVHRRNVYHPSAAAHEIWGQQVIALLNN